MLFRKTEKTENSLTSNIQNLEKDLKAIESAIIKEYGSIPQEAEFTYKNIKSQKIFEFKITINENYLSIEIPYENKNQKNLITSQLLSFTRFSNDHKNDAQPASALLFAETLPKHVGAARWPGKNDPDKKYANCIAALKKTLGPLATDKPKEINFTYGAGVPERNTTNNGYKIIISYTDKNSIIKELTVKKKGYGSLFQNTTQFVTIVQSTLEQICKENNFEMIGRSFHISTPLDIVEVAYGKGQFPALSLTPPDNEKQL